jgi:uncharacterized protein with HEPN domain
MLPEEADTAHLWDMLDAAKAVRQFVGGRSFDDYTRDSMLRAAVERKIEIIGEAARRISQRTQATHPEVPWRKIMAQRHVLAHEYGEIEDSIIWRVATVHIPELVEMLERFAPPAPTP